MEIRIRKAIPDDYPQIIQLFREFAEFERTPEKMVNTAERMLLEKDQFHCLVAETPKKGIAGYVTYFFCYFTWIGKSMYMDDLYVKPEFRGCGIGTKLIHRIIKYAKDSHCHKIRWQVSGWNEKSIAFYKKLGAAVNNVEHNCDLLLD